MQRPTISPTMRLDAIVLTNFLGLGIVIAAVPRYLHGELGATRFQTGLATTIYFVAALLCRPFVGNLADRIGRRPLVVIAPLAASVFCLAYIKVHSVEGVAALRFLAGGFASFFFTSVALAVTDIVPAEHRTAALGRQSVMTYTGFTIGPLIADRLLDYGWTWVWVVPALLHVLTTLLALTLGETHQPAPRQPRLAGAPRNTLLDLRVLRPSAGVFIANFTFSTVVAFLPEFSEIMNIARPGALFATYAIAVLLIRALTSRIADRLGPAKFMVPSMIVGIVGLVGLSQARTPWQAFIAVAIVGCGIGALFPAAVSSALSRSEPENRGKALGTALSLGDIGQASAGPLVGLVSSQLGFRWIYGIPAMLACVALWVVATMPEVRGSSPGLVPLADG